MIAPRGYRLCGQVKIKKEKAVGFVCEFEKAGTAGCLYKNVADVAFRVADLLPTKLLVLNSVTNVADF
jgi:hypothetical protein